MKRKCLFLLFFLILLSLPGKEIEAIQIRRPPVIDGKLDDLCWQQGGWNTDFTVLTPNGGPAKEQTRFKVGADQNGLYFAVSCQDSSLKAAEKPHDAGFSSDDCLELFLVPDEKIPDDPNIRVYYHFLINAAGSRTELFSRGGVGNVKWNCRWHGMTRKTAVGWDAELFIPFCAFHKPSAGTWRFNLGRGNPNRENVLPRKVELSTWTPIAFFRDLDHFSKLRGLNFDPSRFTAEISDLRITPSFVNGRIQSAITGKFRYAAGKPLMVNCLVSGGENIYSSNTVLRTPDGNSIDFKIPCGVNRTGRFVLRLSGQDSRGMVFYSEQERELNLAPVSIRMHRRYRPLVICSKYPDKRVSFDCTFLLAPKVLAEASAELVVESQNGQRMFSRKIDHPKQTEVFSFDAAAFPPGKYRMEIRVSANRRELGTLRQVLTVAEPMQTEVWIDQDGNLMINGKKIYPVGFMGLGCELSVFDGSGCNVMHSYALHYQKPDQLKKTLDECLRHNIRVMILPYPRFQNAVMMKKGITQEQWRKTGEHVRKFRHHPAILGWSTFDEPRSPEWIDTLKVLRRRLEEWDPTHPVFGNDDSAAGCIGLEGASDVIMLDLYQNPIRGGGNLKPLLSIYNSIEQIRRQSSVPSVWDVPQAFVFYPQKTNNRTPTFGEIRCAVYCAVAAGAKGILPYQTGSPANKKGFHCSPDMKIGYLKGVCPELAELSPALTAETVEGKITADNPDIRILVKKYRGKLFIIAVNPFPKSIGQAVLNGLPDGEWKVLSEKRRIKPKSGKLTDHFGKEAVHIYVQDPDFPDRIDLKQVQSEIDRENRGNSSVHAE